MAATGKVIGTVTAVVGEAKATAADGTVRILQVGDAVHSDEVISTSAAGSINVVLANGKTLDCGADADLALHQGILDVGMTAAPSPASDVDSIQRAIAAGQDPSQVAAATAAGGAPAAGGADDGGAHTPVIIEQGSSASVVSSGFSTEGDSIAFPNETPQALPGVVVVASTPAPVVSNSEQHAPVFSAIADEHSNAPASVSAPSAPAFETNNPVVAANEPAPSAPAFETNNPVVASNEPAPSAGNQPEAPVTVDAPVVVADAGSTPVVVADAGSNSPAEQPQPPAAQNEPSTPTTEQPSTPAEEPIIVASNDEQPTTPSEDPVIPTSNDDQPGDEQQPPVVTDTTDQNLPPVTDGGTPTDEPWSPGTVSLSYSLSANTNQDEQIGMLTFENGGNEFQTLVFFGQEGQQNPTSMALGFDLTEATSTVTLQYVDSFAGNSDSNTGHTNQKIAVKDFGLGIDGEQVVLAQQSDGVNVGVGSKTLMTEGSVDVDMSTGHAGDWSFSNPSTPTGIDILDFTGSKLDLGAVVDSDLESIEVINLKGSATQELSLSVGDVLKVTDGADVLHVVGGKEDTLNLTDSGWHVADGDAAAAGIQPSYFGWVQVTHDSGATLLVDPDVNIKGAQMG
jgi:hypothetical protein